MSLKDSIRKATVGAKKNFRTTELDFEGNKVMFKQLSQRERKELIGRCKDESGDIDGIELQIWSVIYMTRDPETGETVYTEDDYESLNEQPAGGFVEKFAEAAIALMSGDNPKDSQES